MTSKIFEAAKLGQTHLVVRARENIIFKEALSSNWKCFLLCPPLSPARLLYIAATFDVISRFFIFIPIFPRFSFMFADNNHGKFPSGEFIVNSLLYQRRNKSDRMDFVLGKNHSQECEQQKVFHQAY